MLFGYDRGHSLLSASRGISKTFASKILPDTDWDPRVSTKVEGYLSGRPVKDEKSYVVMKTWPDPEMPRPGCVWTHALIISEADLSRIPDLTMLARQIKRPQDANEFSEYDRDIALQVSMPSATLDVLNERTVLLLMELVYRGHYDPTTIEHAEFVEAAMLAIWSQQWPALRRRFSFRTAPLSRHKQSRRSDFEVELSAQSPDQTSQAKNSYHDVFKLLVKDAIEGGSSEIRRFLWRYGADTGTAKENLLSLAHIYKELFLARKGETNVLGLITEIGEKFPTQNSAHLLKKDLTQSEDAGFSLLPALDQFDVVLGVQSPRHSSAFPELGPLHRKTVTSWVSSRPLELSTLLRNLAEDHGAFADSIFDGVAFSNDQDFIWQLLEKSETAFVRSLGSSIGYLDDERIEQLVDETLLHIVETANPLHKKPLANLVPRLLLRDSPDLISAVHSAAPEAVTAAVIDKLATDLEKDQSGSSVHVNWVEYVKDHSEEVVHYAEKFVETRRQLLICRYLLNADTKRVPLTVWSSRLEDIQNDLLGSFDLEFRVFLLIEALSKPLETAPVLFRDTFDRVYDALAGNRLRFRTEMLLAEHLPHIGWFNNWDKCLRLKIAVVGCYKHLGLSKKQLLRVTSNSSVGRELEQLWDQHQS